MHNPCKYASVLGKRTHLGTYVQIYSILRTARSGSIVATCRSLYGPDLWLRIYVELGTRRGSP